MNTEDNAAAVIQAQGFRCNHCGTRLTDANDYGDELGLCFDCAESHYSNE